jgi:TRAP-type C4-dicarboxylate transport system permease small subunit
VKTLSAFATSLSRLLYVVAGVALAGSMFLTVADVSLRTLKRPIVGTYELVGLLGALVVGFAIPQTSRLHGNVLMDFVTGKLSAGIQRVLHVITRILATGLFAIIGWNMVNLGNDLRRVGEVTPTLQLPTYPVAYAIALCCLVECFVLLVDMIEKRGTES